MANNNSLSIFLIKNDFHDFEGIIRDDISKPNSFEIHDVGTVFFLNSNIYPPSWLESFFLNDTNLQDKLYNSSSKATLLIRTQVGDNEERIFALVFGRGGSLLKDTVVEDRFGLKIALNLIGEKNIRNISKTVIGGSQKNTIEQMPKQSTIDEFEIDIDTDLVSRVTGKVEKDKFVEGTVTGSDLLLVKHPVDITNVIPFLNEVYKCYLSKDYLKSFEWIDQVKIVKDKNLIKLLDQELIRILNLKNDDFWMAVPEIIDWDNVKGFRVSGIRDEIFDDIDIENVIASLRDSLTSSDQLKNKQIHLVDLNDQEYTTWSAYKCLYGELSYSGHAYCLNSGKWYAIDNDYAKRIEEQYNLSVVSDINFVEYQKGQKEEDYNLSLANSDVDEFICLDKKLVRMGKNHNPIEICDVLSKGRQMIHVKKYAGSSVLSHLFNQGLVSATLLKKGDFSYLQESNQVIGKITEDAEYKLEPSNQYEVVYGIISKENENLPNIPFFSKISFCSIRDRLKLMNFNCSIKSIRKRDDEETDSHPIGQQINI